MGILSLIVAMTPDRVIGQDNRLPWHLPADMKHFRAVTWGKPIVMGRKTYESIGKPLPGRLNIVLSHNPHLHLDGCQVVHTQEEIVSLQQVYEEVMVIGGAIVYSTFLPYAQRLYITWVHAQVSGDAFFPLYLSDEYNCYPYCFEVVTRI
jgi:dihydrofolate reductase